MSTRRKLAWSGSAVLFALLLAFGAIPAQNGVEQTPTQAVFYGKNVEPGSKVEVIVSGTPCGVTTVDSNGKWQLTMACTDPQTGETPREVSTAKRFQDSWQVAIALGGLFALIAGLPYIFGWLNRKQLASRNK